MDQELELQAEESIVNDVQQPLIEQEHANKIAQAAYARGVKAAENKLSSRLEQLENMLKSRNNESFDREQLLEEAEKRASERVRAEEQQKQEEILYKSLAKNYNEKLKLASEKFEDFEEKIKDYDPKEFPNFSMAIAQIDDGEDALYHLLDRGTKLHQIDEMLRKNPNSLMAKKEIKKIIEDARKQNAISSKISQTSKPLSKINPSNVSSSKNGEKTVEMLRSEGFYRF